MCGIFGAVGPVGAAPPLSERDAIRLRDLMAPRGPDDAGLFIRGPVVLAHRRLAIRDPAAGRQPWVTPDGSLAVVYNGELYNDSELRTELTRRGFRFRTRCDTELIPAAYRAWGDGCVTRFRGDFAFGLYDFDRGRLLLARDRAGVKPLHFAAIDGSLVFASTVAAIRRHPAFRPRPNWAALSHYLTTLRITLGPETVFEDLFTLQPGERLVLEDGRVTVERWATLPDARPIDPAASVTEELDQHLRDATRRRLSGDVPAGLFLSGGVDSSTVASLVTDELGAGLPAACGVGTAADVGPGDDEFAAIAARHVGSELTKVTVGPEEYRDRWLGLLDAYDTPVSTPTDVILLRLAEETRRFAKFVLSGEGADELFCGYAVAHRSGRDYERAATDGAWTASPSVAAAFRASLRRNYGRERFVSPTEHYFALNSLIPTAAKPHLFRPEIWDAAGRDAGVTDAYDGLFREHEGRGAEDAFTRVLHRVNLEALLGRLDSATGQAGLEARPVYTDDALVDFGFGLPHRLKIGVAEDEPAPFLAAAELHARGSLLSKRPLRAVARTLMPRRLADRPKAAFPTPVAGWLGDEWAAWAGRTLRESPFAAAVFRPEAIEELAADPRRAGMWLWPVLNVSLWGDRQFAA